jgi:hypothetical protein
MLHQRIMSKMVMTLSWRAWAQSWVAWAADGFLTRLERRRNP